jgi:hypothetical protein
MLKYYLVFLIITPLMALYLHRWAVIFVKSIHHVGVKFSKRARGFVFIPIYLIAVILMLLPVFFSMAFIIWLFPKDTNNAWSTIIVLVINWIISFIPAIIYINRNKDKMIAAGYLQEPIKKKIA